MYVISKLYPNAVLETTDVLLPIYLLRHLTGYKFTQLDINLIETATVFDIIKLMCNLVPRPLSC